MGDELTIEHLRKAKKMLEDGDRADREQREKRRLKDMGKLSDFIRLTSEAIKRGEKEIEGLIYTVEMLANGYFLVMGGKQYEASVEELKKRKVPDEVIANIYRSDNIQSKL